MSGYDDDRSVDLGKEALTYHRQPSPGKLEVVATKPLANQMDLSLAYSPGVAAACQLIADDPQSVREVTARGNLVAVITNGTAVLGLGAIGPLAAKPVMEGKAVLFKKFSGIDVFDLEVDCTDVETFCRIVASLEPTFAGINLEDIKAPECFEIEKRLKEMMAIPVFHDDQHGTAIIVASAAINGLELVGKDIKDCKIVCSGAGAAALACLGMLEQLGAPRKNITVCDVKGVLYTGRDGMDPYKCQYARKTRLRTLPEAMEGADIFLGLSAGGIVEPSMVASMAKDPLIFALANPDPEIRPELAQQARPDAICATGRSDYPNQINNVLCFPYIFRGALDVEARTINDPMKLAAAHAIARLARMEASDVVARAYTSDSLEFGKEMLIPKPFDPRLILEIAPAVARAAMDSGVAHKPLADMDQYRADLQRYVYRSGAVMKPLVDRAQKSPKRICLSEGEDERVLRALQFILDEGFAQPIIVGRRRVVETRIKRMGLRYVIDKDVELVDPENDPRFNQYWSLYHEIMGRQGVPPSYAKNVVRTRNTVIGCLMLLREETDALLCGLVGQFPKHFRHVQQLLASENRAPGILPAALSIMLTDQGPVGIADTHINVNPSAEHLVQIAEWSMQEMHLIGIVPKVAFLSHSNFGSSRHPQAQKMRRAYEMFAERNPDVQVEGEVRANIAMDSFSRNLALPGNKLEDNANLLIMPDLDSANITHGLLETIGNAQAIGPMLVGVGRPVHVLPTSISVREVVNMATIAVLDAQKSARLL